jgi:hypothetical protein
LGAVTEALTVTALTDGDADAWHTFLLRSANGTLFHDLNFLAYHPPERFRFQHLLIRNGAAIVALVPGGLVNTEEGLIWRSPLGASVGGPVVLGRPRLAFLLDLVAAMQRHARCQGWFGIDMALPPAAYHAEVGDLIGFALFRQGFRERHRWICPMIDVARLAPGTAPATALFERRQADALRAALRNGAAAVEAGVDGLDQFAPVFRETYARHGVNPTHTLAEMEHLLHNFPDRLRIILARQEGVVTAGILVMQLTPAVATTFYICSAANRARSQGPLVAIAQCLEGLGRRGCRWLDLGPSGSDTRLNPGVMFFKEGLGAVGHCRSQWFWNATP